MTTNMKKAGVAATLSMFALAASAAATMAQGDSGPRVTVNDHPVQFEGQPPVEQSGRVLVPLRGVLEKIGAYVEYNEQTHAVTAYRGSTHIGLTIGSTQARVGDHDVTLDVPAQVMNGSTMVPLRFVAESLGAHVAFHSDSDTVAIWTGQGGDGGDAHASSAVLPPREDSANRAALVGTVVSVAADESPARITIRVPARDGSGTVDRDLTIRRDAKFTFQRPNDTERDITLDHIRRGEQVSVTTSDGGRVTAINVIAPAFDARRSVGAGAFHGEFQEMHRRDDGMLVLRMADNREIVVSGDTPVMYKDQTIHVRDLRPGDDVTIAVDPVTHHGSRIMVDGK